MNIRIISLLALIFFGRNMQGLKILFFDHTFPALTQTFILNQITGIIDRGHDVTILALGKDGQSSERGSKIHPDVYTYDLLSKVYYRHLPPDKRDFDLVVCEFGHLGNIFLKLQKEWGVKGKILTFFRGRDLNALGSRRYYQKLFSKGDYFLPVCHYFKKKLIRLGCNKEKIYVIHSAIDLSKFPYKDRKISKDGKIKIITTNRLVPKKGTEYAIKAVARLLKKYPQIEYTIIGGGPLQKHLQKIIDTYHAGNNIHLVGWKSQEEVARLLNESHIFMLPSVTPPDGDKEGIPNAIKEAIACGLPVVATYHSGIPEVVVNRKNGFLVPEKDVVSLVKRLDFLITHPDLWPKMGKVGRQIIKSGFDKDRVNDKFHKLCLKFAQPNKRKYTRSLQGNLYTDAIIFSEDNPLLLAEYLSSYSNNVFGADKLYIFYKTSFSASEQSYQLLKERCETKNIHFIHYDNNLSTVLNERLTSSEADFVFLVSPQHKIIDHIDLCQAACDLEQEDAYAVYFSCGIKDAQQRKVESYQVAPDIYKWQLSKYKKGWGEGNNFNGALYRKDQLLKAINTSYYNFDELKNVWSKFEIELGSYGLFYKHASITVR